MGGRLRSVRVSTWVLIVWTLLLVTIAQVYIPLQAGSDCANDVVSDYLGCYQANLEGVEFGGAFLLAPLLIAWVIYAIAWGIRRGAAGIAVGIAVVVFGLAASSVPTGWIPGLPAGAREAAIAALATPTPDTGTLAEPQRRWCNDHVLSVYEFATKQIDLQDAPPDVRRDIGKSGGKDFSSDRDIREWEQADPKGLDTACVGAYAAAVVQASGETSK
jgi:hypothetical protein